MNWWLFVNKHIYVPLQQKGVARPPMAAMCTAAF
jgi:hypothetical protein